MWRPRPASSLEAVTERLVITHVGHRGDGIAESGGRGCLYSLHTAGRDGGSRGRARPSRPAQSSARRNALARPHRAVLSAFRDLRRLRHAALGGRALSRLEARSCGHGAVAGPHRCARCGPDRRAWRRPAARGAACAARNQRHPRSRLLRLARAYHYCDRCLPGAGAVDGRNDPGGLGHRRSALAPEKAARYPGDRDAERPRCRCARLRTSWHEANRRTGAGRRTAQARPHHAPWRDGDASAPRLS